MSNMSEYLLSDEGLRAMMNLLLICVALVIAVVGFLRYCERTDAIWQAENPAPRYPVNPSNVANLLASMDCLRTPLPPVYKAAPLEDDDDLAETLRVSKLS